MYCKLWLDERERADSSATLPCPQGLLHPPPHPTFPLTLRLFCSAGSPKPPIREDDTMTRWQEMWWCVSACAQCSGGYLAYSTAALKPV